MEGLDRNTEAHGWRDLPLALWTYFATLASSVVVAVTFSTLTFHPEAFYLVLYIVLLVGLLKGSRICRLFLTFLSALSAYGLLMIQIGAFDFPGILLVGLCFAQVALLCVPPMRAFTSRY